MTQTRAEVLSTFPDAEFFPDEDPPVGYAATEDEIRKAFG